MHKPLVIIESPFACGHGNTCNPSNCDVIARNVKYARAAMRDCILKGEVPNASHLLYTQDGVLDDNVPEERQLGIDLGLELRRVSEKTVVYTDLGTSRGMKYGIADAEKHNRPVEYRTLAGWSQA
jgi:hypothetical protein